jgi:hypothetical protein
VEDQIPALIARHLREAKREREGLLYGFKTPVLEAGFVEGADTITVGMDWDLGPQTRRFIPMQGGDTDGRLVLSRRDAMVLNFKHYSDDRTRGTVSNLTLNMTDSFILIPSIEVKLGESSVFPRHTSQHELIKKGKDLYYRSKTDGRPDEVEGTPGKLQILRYSPKEMGRNIGHLLSCQLLYPSSTCCAPNKYLCLEIKSDPRTFPKVRGRVKSYSGIAVQIDLLVDSCAYCIMLPWEMRDKLGLTAGRTEEAVMADGTVRRGQIFDVQLNFIDEGERQLTLQGPLLFLQVSNCILGQDIIGQFCGIIGQCELILQCPETRIVLPLITTPGFNHCLMISENSETMQKNDRKGGMWQR